MNKSRSRGMVARSRFAFMLVALSWLFATRAAAEQPSQGGKDFPTIRLPLRIVVCRGITMTKRDVAMDSWVTKEEIAKTVVPELNRIWSQAGIEWTIESIVENPIGAQVQEAAEDSIQTILNSRRGDTNEPDKNRTKAIKSFFDHTKDHPVAHTLHFFPYLGSTYQGFADIGGTQSYLGLWTDKPSGGTNPPQRVLLAEPLPMKIGSLGRTMAHELGHNLGLHHPDKKNSPPGLLMGGSKQGYLLTPEQIATARATATALVGKLESRK